MSLLSLTSIAKDFHTSSGPVRVLDGVNLSLEAGEPAAIACFFEAEPRIE